MTAPTASSGRFLSHRGFAVALLVCVIFCLLILIAFTVKSMIDSRSRALDIAVVTSRIQAQLLAEHASSEFQSIDLTLQILMEKIRHEGEGGETSSPEVLQAIRRRIMFMPQIENLLLLDAAGDTRFAVDSDEDASGVVLDASLLGKHRDAWIDFQIAGVETKEGAFRLAFSRRIDRPDGTFGGALVAIVDPSFFRRRYEEYAASGVDAVALYNTSGRVVSSFINPAAVDGEPADNFSKVRDIPLLSAIPASLLFEGGLRGGETRDAVFAIYQLNHFPFHIVLAHGKRQILAPARLESRRHLAVILFATLLAAGLTALARHQVTRRKRTEADLLKTEDRARLMAMLREIALSSSQASSIQDALEGTLPPILDYTRWPLGAAWTLETSGDGERLVLSSLRARAEEIAPVAPLPEETDFSAFSSLRRPLWIQSLDDAPHRSELAFARNVHMQGAILAPVMRGDEPAAVLGLFTRRHLEPDADLDGVIHQALAPVGRMMERLRAEEALRESEELYRRMFETTSAVKLLVEPENGTIVDANAAACAFYSRPKQAMREQTIFDFNTLPRAEVAKCMADALSGRRGYFEFVHRRSTGETRHVEVYSGPVVVKGRTLLHSIIHDVSERKRLQEELIKARKMEAIGVLSGDISHDFNNLLSIIIGNLELVKDDLAPVHPAKPWLDAAEAGAERAKALIRTFLLISGASGKRREPVDIGDTLRAAAAEALRGGGAICEFDLSPDIPYIQANREGFHLSFRNLLTNANEAMPDGGTVRVSAGIVPKADLPVMAEDTEDHGATWVRIDIEDEGIGIPKDRMPRIFDPYYSTKERGSQKGMGLGLAMVQSVIKAHGGRIEAASTPAGTSFRIYLPVPAG